MEIEVVMIWSTVVQAFVQAFSLCHSTFENYHKYSTFYKIDIAVTQKQFAWSTYQVEN